MDNLSDRREKLCEKFAANCVSNVRTKKHFIRIEKTHGMQTRKAPKFKVKFAKTEKLKKSAVPYLQNIAKNLHDNNEL